MIGTKAFKTAIDSIHDMLFGEIIAMGRFSIIDDTDLSLNQDLITCKAGLLQRIAKKLFSFTIAVNISIVKKLMPTS